ncbi:hypothetical protein [Zunongwangia sp. HGR-M22]|uniref:hypothetical protein n=1 Tax=Zunongwangia sp. HGR-M22 TaxID=3015168 RepID=UPI0022DE732F|nr:hypothetical protein [Zunongwangia sp. HGR-M22]WBL24446.1 hypothetical protein PBT91_11035 [Zunongwangia sp. HGR-M22]
MKKYTLIIIVLALIFVPSSCEKMPDEVVDDFKLGINSDFLEYTLVVQFVDAGNPITPPENIELKVLDNDNNGLLDSNGNKEFTVDNGIASFILNPTSKPNGADDVKTYTIYATASGFLPVNFTVNFTEDQKNQNLTINMVNTSSPPEGVANITKNIPLIGGTLNSSASVAVASEGNKITGADLTIDSGTEFYDTNNNKITGGSLRISLTHFDANGAASLNSFPGGFTPESVIGESGEEEEIFFVTAGFASIDMNIDGTSIRKFSKPIEVTMEINPNGYNLETDSEIKVGDKIPVWSYEVESGQWVFEKEGSVVNNSGKLEVSFETDHLTWYNLDFYGRRCYKSNSIVINAPGTDAYDYFYTELVYEYNDQPVSYYARKNMRLYNNAKINFYRCPIATCKFKIYSGSSWYNKGELIAETAPFNPCSKDISITLPASAFPEVVSADVTLSCPDSNFEFKPSYYFYYKEKGSYWWRYGYMSNGKFQSYYMTPGKTYDFRTYFGDRIETEFTVSSGVNYITINSDEICEFAL